MSDARPDPAYTWAGKVLKESGIGFGGSLLGTALNYVVLIVLTRFLSPDELGLFTLGQSVLAIALIFVLIGTPRALDRFIPYYLAGGRHGVIRSLIRSVIAMSAATSAAVMLVLIGGAGWLSDAVFKTSELTWVLRLMVLAVPMLAWIELVSASFAGFKELRYRVYTHQLSLPILKVGFAVLLLSLGYGLAGWLWAYLASLVVTSAYALWLFRRHIISRLRGSNGETADLRHVLSYSWPLSISNLVVVFAANIGILLLGCFGTTSDVGVYRVYVYMILILVLAQSSFGRIYKPVASGFVSSGNAAEGELLYKRVGKWMLIVGGYGSLVVMLFGRDIVALLFPEGYQTAAGALVVLALGRLMVAVCGPQGVALEAFGSTRLSLVNALLMLGLNLGLGYLLIPSYGITGAALAMALAQAGGAVAGLVGMRVVHGLLPFGRPYLLAVAALAASGLPAWLLVRRLGSLNAALTVGAVVALAAVYGFALWSFRALDEVDYGVLARIRNRMRGRPES